MIYYTKLLADEVIKNNTPLNTSSTNNLLQSFESAYYCSQTQTRKISCIRKCDQQVIRDETFRFWNQMPFSDSGMQFFVYKSINSRNHDHSNHSFKTKLNLYGNIPFTTIRNSSHTQTSALDQSVAGWKSIHGEIRGRHYT